MACIGKNPYRIEEVWYSGILGLFKTKFYGSRQVLTTEQKLQNDLYKKGIPFSVPESIENVQKGLYGKHEKIIFDMLVDRKQAELRQKTIILYNYEKHLKTRS